MGLWGGLGLCGGASGLALAPSCSRLGEAGSALTSLLCLQALIPLSLEGTEVGQTKAAQALAKITITSNPEMAFPGERVRVAAVGTCPLPAPCSGSTPCTALSTDL